MFRTIASTGFIVVFAAIACHLLISRPKRNNLFVEVRHWRILDVLRLLVYLFALLCFVILTVNGFYSSLILHEPITGYRLILQTTAGGAFTVCLAILAVMWAHNCRLDKNYYSYLQKLIAREPADTPTPQKYELAQKICFWLIVMLALPLILSIVLSMFTLFGTDGQKFLLQLHRYSALLLALAAIIHAYLLIRTKMNK